MGKKKHHPTHQLALGQKDKLNNFFRILTALIIGLVPLIVYCKLQTFVTPNFEKILYYPTSVVTDFYSYYKSVLLLVLTAVMLCAYLFKLFTSKTTGKIKPLEILILIFMAALCVSILTTDYKTMAMWGGYLRNLGAIAYLACALILLIIADCVVDLRWKRTAFAALYPFIAINSIIAVLVYLHVNLWDVDFLARLLTGGHTEYLSKNAVLYGTLSHFNFLSGMSAILFALFACEAVLADRKLTPKGTIHISAAVLSTIIVFASKSLSGIVTMAFIIVLLLGLVVEGKGKNAVPFFLILGLTVLSWTALSIYDSAFIIEVIANGELVLVSGGLALLILAVYFCYRYWPLIDPKKRIIGGIISLLLVIGILIPIVPKAHHALAAELHRIDTTQIEQRLKQNEFDFPDPEFTWGTGRLYIWKETLKLVAERPLFGYGFDTLFLELDPTDPAKIAAMNSPDVIIDKPHNAYLNMLYGSGSIALLSLLAIVIQVLFTALKAIKSSATNAGLIWPLVFGILAYLYQGLFNDPIQGVESLFWVLLGLCYGLARYVHDRS